MKIVQAADAAHHFGKSRRNRRLSRVRVMHLPVHAVAVNLRTQGIADLLRGAAELDPVAAARDGVYRETFRLDPRGELGGVVRARAEAVGVFFRCEPFVVIGRRRVLLPREQLPDPILLFRRLFQQQHHSSGPERRLDGTLIVCGCRPGVPVASQDHRLRAVGLGCDPVALDRLGACTKTQNWGD